MQKGLNCLLEKYSVKDAAVISADGESVTVGGEAIPILPWEAERRFVELKNLVSSGRLGGMCTYRIGHTARVGSDLFALLRREIGIIEFTVGSRVKEICAIGGNGAMNCIAETENGCVCTVELGATLSEGEQEVDKHEIITDGGVASDRVVDTQIPQSSIYVRGKRLATYTDTDAELYGYSEGEINVIRAALAIAASAERRERNKETGAHLERVIAAAKKSLDALCNIGI